MLSDYWISATAIIIGLAGSVHSYLEIVESISMLTKDSILYLQSALPFTTSTFTPSLNIQVYLIPTSRDLIY